MPETAERRPLHTDGAPNDLSLVTTIPARADSRDAAIAAARRGWYVFPTRPGGKEPREGLSWPTAATSDPARVAIAHWRPGENYGIAAKPSGLVILDLDLPKPGYVLPPGWREPGIVDGKDVLARLAGRATQEWPCTFTVETPSGGWHLYYLAPAGRAIGNRPAGPLIDVRGGGSTHGGYVVGPGSVIGGRAYRIVDGQEPVPLPGWLADLLDPPRTEPAHRPATADDGVYGRLRGVVETVVTAPPGARNGRLYWAACRASEMVQAGRVDQATAERVLLDAALEAGLRGGESEARRTIASGMRGAA